MALSPETLEYLKNYQPSAGAAPAADDQGITDHLLWTLGLLTRPSKALWTGVDEFMKPEGSTWQGVKRGFYDEPGAKELADVVGLPEGKADDEWAPWLGKEAARLVTSAIGDPLSYAFAPAKAAGIAKSGIGVGPALLKAGVPEGKSLAGVAAKALGSERLTEGFYGSSIGKVLKSGLPKTKKYEPIQQEYWKIEREGSKIPIQESVVKAQKELDEALADTKYTYADVTHALERPDEVTADLIKIADIARPLQEMKDSGFNTWNTLKGGLDQEITGKLEGGGYFHMPHNVTDKELLKLRRVGDIDLATDAFKQSGRNIKRYVDETGYFLEDAAGTPVVGKLSDPRTQMEIKSTLVRNGLSPDYVEAHWKDLVSDAPATLRDIKPIMPEGSLIENPVESLGTTITNRQGQINTLKLLDYLRGENLLWHTGKNTPEHLLKGSRQLQIPGFETWATTPQLANWLENMAGVPTDWLGKSLQKARQTPIGQGLEDLTQWWKRNALAASPSYWTGNLVSDTFNRYASGGQNPAELVGRMGEAYHTLGGGNPELLRELQIRGLPVSSWAGSIAEESKNLPPSRLRDVADDVPGLNKIMDALGYTSEKWRDFNNAAFRVGNKYTEAPGRVATAIDYLKKNAPDYANPTPEMLDRAAAFAKESLVDYGPGGLTATQRELQRLLIPFAGWMFGMPTLMTQQVMKNPDRLARVSRTLDSAFMPLSPEDRAVADPYLHENAPVRGVADWEFPRDDKGIPQIMQLGRYLPWGVAEGLTNRSPANTWSSVNPWLKAPVEMALNLSGFSNQPIDRSAQGFGAALTNPITGGPRSKSRQEYFGQSIPAGYEYLLNQSPAGRNVQSVNDLLRSFGLWEDPYKAKTTPLAQAATLVTGGKFTTFDREKQRMHRKAEYTQTEKAIEANMKYALNKYDIEGYNFYLKQLLDHAQKKSQKLGYSTPGA